MHGPDEVPHESLQAMERRARMVRECAISVLRDVKAGRERDPETVKWARGVVSLYRETLKDAA